MGKRIFFVLLTVVLLTGCGVLETEVSQDTAKKVAVLNEGVSGEEISLTSSHVALEGRFEKAIVLDDTVYGCSLSVEGLTVIRQDVQSETVLQQILIADVDEVYGLVAAQEDAVLVVASQEGIVSCWEISEGSSQAELLYEDIGLEDLKDGEVSDCMICQDQEGHYYFWVNAVLPANRYSDDADEKTLMNVGRVYVKDSLMQTLYYEEIPVMKGSRMLGFCFDDEGNPLILAKDSSGSYVKIMDADTQESTEQRIDGLEVMADADAFAVVEGGLLYCQGTYLYEYRVEEQSIATLLDLSVFGITASDIIYLCINDGVYEIVDNYGTDNSEYACIREGVSEEIVLTLGINAANLEAGYTNLYKCVTQFNRYNDNIRIELVNYYDETAEAGSGFDVGRDQLSLDLVRGTAPDLMVVTESMRDMLADKGVFVDLYEMMELDADFDRDDLMTQVTDLYESNGKLYSLAPDFFLMSIWGSSDVIQGRSGVTLTEFEEILEENGRDVNAVWGFYAGEAVLTTLCEINWDVLIDWESRTCDFESETFRMMMEFAAERVIGSSTGASYRDSIRSGECLMEMGSIASVADHQLEEAIWDTDLEYIGYPTENGSGTALKFISDQLAINANSEQKEAAWEFLKYYLTGLSGHGFPVVTALFEEQMELAMEDDYEWAIDAGEIQLMNKGVYTDNSTGESICVYKASQEDVDTVIGLINSADRRYYSFTEVENIITEEAAYYFAGQKSFEEVAALIQNRVQLYLNEG
ncbi:MAG: extracellular solute-binding protein [Lachnospiraceae bacterium]|nr:extracellular solute-binding protein [Lachnospiraceae bacterium]